MELEAWFIGSISSLRGQFGIPGKIKRPKNPESIRGAKEFLSNLMNESYAETFHQPKMASSFDLDVCLANCRSFRKLCSDITSKIVPFLSGYSNGFISCMELSLNN
jgi:hypothetical protein